MFVIEFFRVRDADGAHAVLDRVEHDTTDLEQAKIAAQSLFVTLDMPQKPDALRIMDQDANEVFVWRPDAYLINRRVLCCNICGRCQGVVGLQLDHLPRRDSHGH